MALKPTDFEVGVVYLLEPKDPDEGSFTARVTGVGDGLYWIQAIPLGAVSWVYLNVNNFKKATPINVPDEDVAELRRSNEELNRVVRQQSAALRQLRDRLGPEVGALGWDEFPNLSGQVSFYIRLSQNGKHYAVQGCASADDIDLNLSVLDKKIELDVHRARHTELWRYAGGGQDDAGSEPVNPLGD